MDAPSRVVPQPRSQPSRRSVRVEYQGFENVAESREYRLAVLGPAGSSEFRFRIALADFAAGRVLLQDGPDVCYQRLLRALAAGETTPAGFACIDSLELAAYREAHTHVPKRRTIGSTFPAPPPAPPHPPSPRTLAAAAIAARASAFAEGQRVRHAGLGLGVTCSSNAVRTVVCFDEHGPRMFATAQLELEALSLPNAWETSPRGKNRLRDPDTGRARR
jgi:hypothetical protein